MKKKFKGKKIGMKKPKFKLTTQGRITDANQNAGV
jgi:hypothetical protein